MTSDNDGSGAFVSGETFGTALGQAVWLMTMSPNYRDLPIRDVETLVATPVLLKQFKLYSKGKQPVAFLSWAMVSDAIKARFEAGEPGLALEDWRSGENMIVVDCVSPFNSAKIFLEPFLNAARVDALN